MYLIVYLRKAATWELYFDRMFQYGKLACLFLFFTADKRIAVYYAICCFILWIVLKYPKYAGPSKLIKAKTYDEFYDISGADPSASTATIVKERRAKSANKDFSKVNTTLAVFNAVWSDNSYFTQTMWVKIANKYTTQRVNFIDLDVGVFSSLARKYNVNTRSTAGQLPTLILFEDGREIERYPFKEEKTGREPVQVDYRERELV